MRHLLLLISFLTLGIVSTPGRSITNPGNCQFSTTALNTISGQIRRPDGRPVPGITVLIDDGMETQSVVTDANGNYSLANLMVGLSYTITPQADEDCFSCLTIHDAVAIEEHFLNETLLETPYQRLAADVNGDQEGGTAMGGISTVDRVLVMRGIYGLPDPFSPCWTFVAADYDFMGDDLPISIQVNNLSDPVVADFIAVKEGDVTECNESLLDGPLELSLDAPEFFCQGSVVEIQVRVSDFVDVQGLQFSLGWDPAVMNLQYSSSFDLLPDFAPSPNLNTIAAAAGRLSLAWSNRLGAGVSIPNGGSIITFGFEVLAGAGADAGIAFIDMPTPPLYVTSELNSFTPRTRDSRLSVPGPRLGVGLTYCYDNQQVIPFLPTYVTNVLNQGGGTLDATTLANGRTFWLTGLDENEDWSLLVTGRAADGFCDEAFSGQTGVCTEARTPSCSPLNLSDNDDFLTSANIWENKVVWHSDVDGDNDIYVYDLLAQTLTNITNNTADDRDPIIQGDHIVYRSDADGDFEIMLYNCRTQETTQVSTNNTPVDTTHDVDGNYIVWRSNFAGDNEIYLYNILSGKLLNISDDDATGAGECSVAGDYVVFITTETGSNDVYRYHIPTGTKTNLTTDTANERDLVMNHRLAAWTSNADGDDDVYVANLFNGQITNASNNNQEDNQPVLGADATAPLDLILTWVTNNLGNQERYYYELGTGIPVAIGTVDGNSPAAVQGGRIIWRSGGGLSVYQLVDGLATNYPTLPGDFPSVHNNHLTWTNNGDIFWYDLALDLPEAAQFDEVNSSPIIPCAGRPATLLLAGFTDWEVVWYDDPALSNEVYVDLSNNFQPVVDGPATYYGCWRDPLTGCRGPAVAVDVDAVDEVPPTLTNCPESQTIQAAPGASTAIATWLPPTGGDNCNIRIDNNFGPGETFPVGITTVTYLASDFAGNTTECSFDITVESNNPEPVEFSLSDAMVQVGETFCVDLTAINFSEIDGFQFTIEYDAALLQFVDVQDDALTGVSFSLVAPGLVSLVWSDFTGQGVTLPDGSRLAGICFEALATGNVGILITGTATPIEVIQGGAPAPSVGNPGTVTITPGMATCPPDALVDNDPGQCEAFVDIPLPSVAGLQILDNDYNGAIDASDTYPVGSTDVTYSFLNPFNGETTSCTFNVTVLDVESPTLTNCPGNQAIQAAPGASTATATWSEPTAADNCTVLIDNNFSPGDAFPIGTTTVIYTATDEAGNAALDCSFDITVQRIDPVPVEYVVGDATTSISTQVCVDVTVFDFMDVTSFQYTIEYDPLLLQFVSGQPGVLPGLQTSLVAPGILQVRWVSPGGAPLSLPDGSVVLTLCFDAIGAGFSPVVITGSSIPVETTKNGQLALTNSVVGSVTVLAGAATCPPNQLVNNDPGQCEAFVNIPLPGTPGLQIIANDYNGTIDASDTYPVGSTDVTYSFLDPLAGDTSFCTFNVTVLDVDPPTIECAGSIVLMGDLATGGAQIDQELATATDNCPGVDLLCAPVPREGFYECGTITEVTCRAVDAAGNESEPCVTVVEVMCEPEGCGPILTTTPVDTTGHDCCWSIDFSNPNDDIINAIKFTALDGVTIDYTLAAGYQDVSHNLTSVLLAPDPLGSLPADVAGLLELCLNNVYVTPQTVLVDYYDAGYEVFCTDTLRFDCPPEPNCLVILSDTLVCDSLNGYRYDLNIQSPPGSDFGIGLLKMTVTSPPELAGTYAQTFSPPLANGQFANASFAIPGSSMADSLCFVLSAHNGPGEELCCFVQDTCVALPVCDPCPQVMSNLKPRADSCCYQLDLTNLYAAAPNFFTQVQTTLLDPGVIFTEVGYELSDPWQWQPLGSDDNDLLWTFNGGVPQGTSEIFDFCVGGVTTTDSVCMEVAWINRQEVICRDTLKIFCPSCILITEDTLTCDPASGIYTYTFSGENWSGGQDANTISLLENDPRFDLNPTTLDLGGTIPPLGSFGPLNLGVIPTGAQPGDTLCFDMVLRNVIQDSINIECCYVTHCIVLPECSGEPAPTCSCEDLPEDIRCGFDISVNCYDITLTPRCLLDDCDEVSWLNENGLPLGNTVGNQSITVSVPGPDNYTFLYQVLRTDDAGNICETVPFGQNVDVPACDPNCRPEDLVCEEFTSVNLQTVDPPTDVDGDGDTDLGSVTIEAISLVEESGVDCSAFLTYSIHRPGETPDPAQTTIILTCDDLGVVDLLVYAWDATGQNNACLVQVAVNDPADHCSGNRAASRKLVLYPNPVRTELILLPPQVGKARVQVLSADGQTQLAHQQDYTTHAAPLDVIRLRPGLYWLKLQYTDGKIFYQRFIKH